MKRRTMEERREGVTRPTLMCCPGVDALGTSAMLPLQWLILASMSWREEVCVVMMRRDRVPFRWINQRINKLKTAAVRLHSVHSSVGQTEAGIPPPSGLPRCILRRPPPRRLPLRVASTALTHSSSLSCVTTHHHTLAIAFLTHPCTYPMSLFSARCTAVVFVMNG